MGPNWWCDYFNFKCCFFDSKSFPNKGPCSSASSLIVSFQLRNFIITT
ncbi:cyclase-associated protein 1-like [Iris pallida]|uniref:Cyclase-associated protein 1-like n=1 Tax=Iris pallida TaxID=29817 RepID=A0AAX6FAY6_IRIPA|nr:cyclase-associated protein 1-like [Iris pallida]